MDPAAKAVPTRAVVSADGRLVIVAWREGGETRAPAAWLFDNADGACAAAGGNRLHSALALAAARRIESARIEAGALQVRFAPGGEERMISLETLAGARGGPAADAVALWPEADEVASTPPARFPEVIGNDIALAAALRQFVRRGLLFLTEAGTDPGPVERFVARFGYVRETNYGRLFDVREEPRPSHLAYSAAGLDLHTDNPYRDPEPTLQILHVLRAARVGGESEFADGFAHAEALRRAAPDRFAILAATPVPFRFESVDGDSHHARAPVIETDGDGRLRAIRLNHRALGVVPLAGDRAEAWYEAYLDFYARAHAPAARISRALSPGEMVLFDNRRVLHGRGPYVSGDGRWLQGCYAERDGLLATLRRLECAA